ncbi:hypothetical protein [Bradyrhizobium sp. dw_78]|uniref:hypothetical protein n=1 Tax=Bradyrhizobium sp. dw_78 TaxID=2719793 RepID=UPI001BD4EC1D|nr:hypothetical protein [Bradyrhizobium sp. dw_78]
MAIDARRRPFAPALRFRREHGRFDGNSQPPDRHRRLIPIIFEDPVRPDLGGGCGDPAVDAG